MNLKLKTALLIGLVAFFFVTTAHAVSLDWVDKDTTIVVDSTFQISKPNTRWDTQTKHYEDPAPVKWVRHVRGPNPQIFLRYRENVTGKTAHVYSKQVRKELQSRGYQVYKTEKKVINNRHVAILHASSGNDKVMVGVWRHRNLGFWLECRADGAKFSEYMSEFNRAIASVKIVKESGL
jgi:hypothetical protein